MGKYGENIHSVQNGPQSGTRSFLLSFPSKHIFFGLHSQNFLEILCQVVPPKSSNSSDAQFRGIESVASNKFQMSLC